MEVYWDAKTGRYRRKNGRFISRNSVLAILGQYLAFTDPIYAILNRYVTGSISANVFIRLVKQEVKNAAIVAYIVGRGGRSQMTQADWGRVGNVIKEQYKFLDKMLLDLPNISEGQLRYRLAMYLNSTREAFERANEIAQGLPPNSLPAYPGSGDTICLTNCKCAWRIVRTKTGWNCYWELGSSQPCETCKERSRSWNPYIINAD